MKDWLPLYAAGSLDAGDRERVRAHLAGCASCRAELASWQAIADAAPPPGPAPDASRLVRAVLTRSALEGPAGRSRIDGAEAGLAEPARGALQGPGGRSRINVGALQGPAGRSWTNVVDLVLAEARLIRLAVPIASALVMALGVAMVLYQPATSALALVAPIVAAAGIAGTYRSGRDPAAELVAATPAAGRLLLLVRIALVFGYDLVLAGAASAAIAATGGAGAADLGALVAGWIGPMALLSSLSLLVAVRFGPDVALGTAVGLWAVRVLAGAGWSVPFIVAAWSTNALVLAASAAIAAAAIVLAGRAEPYRGASGEPGAW